MSKRMVRQIILLIALILIGSSCNTLKAQHNPCDRALLIGSAAVTFNSAGWMTGKAQIGLWSNSGANSWTANVGYESGVQTHTGTKNDPLASYNTLSIEGGYKVRLTSWLISHAYVGRDKDIFYSGGELLYQGDGAMLIGVKYEKKRAGLSVILRIN